MQHSATQEPQERAYPHQMLLVDCPPHQTSTLVTKTGGEEQTLRVWGGGVQMTINIHPYNCDKKEPPQTPKGRHTPKPHDSPPFRPGWLCDRRAPNRWQVQNRTT